MNEICVRSVNIPREKQQQFFLWGMNWDRLSGSIHFVFRSSLAGFRTNESSTCFNQNHGLLEFVNGKTWQISLFKFLLQYLFIHLFCVYAHMCACTMQHVNLF